MSNDEQQLQIAPKTQQQRRSRRLVIGGGSMTKTRPKQENANIVDNQRYSNGSNNSDNDISNKSQNNAPDQVYKHENENNNDPDASSLTVALAAAATSTSTVAPPLPPSSASSTAPTAKQNKIRVRMVRRSNEPAEEDIKLMKLIKVYPFLYDKADSAYGKKKTSWDAWETIAKAMKLPVFTCKERWRNIRAAFMRSIDYYKTQNGPNRSKQYYMNEELSFLKNCVDKQKRVNGNGVVAENDSSSNDADDSQHANIGNNNKNNFLIIPATIPTINNTTISSSSSTSINELRETGSSFLKQSHLPQQQQQQQPQLKSLTSEIATTLNGQMVLQNNASTIVSVTTAPQSNLTCNGIALPTLSLPSASSSSIASLTTSAPQPPPPLQQQKQISMHQISLPIPFQLPATSTPKSSSPTAMAMATTIAEQQQQQNDSSDLISAPPTKRRRYYEYDEKSDIFKRVQLPNIFDGWSDSDSDGHFLKSLFLKMRNLNEDQSLRFQCKALNALREVQMSTPKTTQQQQQHPQYAGNNSSSTLRLDHLNDEQRTHIHRYIQHITNDTPQNTTTITQQPQQQSLNNSFNDNLLARRLDLTPMVMPLLIKDELLDPDNFSN